MKVFFHNDFYRVYTSDPAAESGRMEAVVQAIKSEVEFVIPEPACEEDIALAHSKNHISYVKEEGLYDISALAAGAAVQAAASGLAEPSFGLIRPPGHHASASSCWGFCYFNNMAIAIEALKRDGKIKSAYILDIDMHYGDGTENILGGKDHITIHNLNTHDRKAYLNETKHAMTNCKADIIGISAGFDNHIEDWGGVLHTTDYFEIGRMVREASIRCNGGCFGILEGGYNHDVLGLNVLSLIRGLSAGQ
ncbi:MAG: histone deacetylase family protein [Desulfobacterales bacterium]